MFFIADVMFIKKLKLFGFTAYCYTVK